MATYTYRPQPAVGADGTLSTDGVGSVYAVTDTGFTTPLTVIASGEVPTTVLQVSPLGLLPGFRIDGHPELIWASGEAVVHIASLTGILEAVESAAADAATSASAATSAAADAADVAAANPAVLPAGGTLGDVLYRGAAERVGQWGPPPGGGGGGSLPIGYPSSWPATFPPSGHSHTTTEVSDATTLGRELMKATSAQVARAAIGAGTGNGTSNLTLGSLATQAAPGNHTHTAADIPFVPSGPITATSVAGAILQAAGTGGSGGASTTLDVLYSAGAYPAQPGVAPTGVKVRHFYGPTPYAGSTWPGVLDLYTYAPLT